MSKSKGESKSESTITTLYNRIFYAKAVINNKLLLEKEKEKEKEKEAYSRSAASSTIGDHIRAFTTRNRYNEMKKSSKSILKIASDNLESLAEIVKKNNSKGLESYVESYVKLELDNIFKSIGIKNNNIDELSIMKEDDIVGKEEVIVYDDKHLDELNGILQILAKYSKGGFIKFKENDDGSYSLIIKHYLKYSFTYKSSNKFLHDIKSYIDYLLNICYTCTNEIKDILKQITHIKIGNEIKSNILYNDYYDLFKRLIKLYLQENIKDGNNINALEEIKTLEGNNRMGGKRTKVKKAPAKKPSAKKPSAKKPSAKKPSAKKPSAKKAPAKKPSAKAKNKSIISYM